MKILDNPPIHITYCLNIHPGETWEENFEAIKTVALEIRGRVAPDKPFGLGLRLGHQSADCLSSPERLDQFKSFLEKHGLYVFTINGFPYGKFHGSKVKENAYRPDWRTRDRRDYTIQLANILSKVILEGVSGSISTVPGSYKKWIRSDSDRIKMIHNLMDCVAHLSEIWERTGQDLHLGLEPEPDCFLETTDEVIAFFTQDLANLGREYLSGIRGCTESEAGAMIARHLGVCFDTCHMSLQFEDLLDSVTLFRKHGIRLSKVQISAALKTVVTEHHLERLKEFCDPVYLHQVKVCCRDDDVTSYSDLPEALRNADLSKGAGAEWRIHFHVPLYFTGDRGFVSTSSDLTHDFFRKIIESGCEHLEIETYTFNVLPEKLKSKGIVESVAEEYRWVLSRFFTEPG